MARNRDDLRRRRPRRQTKRCFLIVCEGATTEKCYFNDVRHIERSLIDLEIKAGGTPKTIVERAVERKRSSVVSSISKSKPAEHQRPLSNGLLSERGKPTARPESSRTTTKSTKKYGAYSISMSIR